MTSVGTLLLLRHAKAEQGPPGGRDVDRRLTERGRTEAQGVGAFLRASGPLVDRVLCSPSVRTRETLQHLGLDRQPTAAVVDLVPGLYQATAEELLELVAEVDASTVLVVGHNPGVPAAVDLLVDPARSSPAAVAALAHRFPPATLARLLVGPAGPTAGSASLEGVRIAHAGDGRYFD